MSIVPGREEFRKLARDGNLVPVYREILADLETPVSAFMKIRGTGPSFLLESIEGGEKWARYSFLGSGGGTTIETRGRAARIVRDGRASEREIERDPMEPLREILAEVRPVPLPALPRFFGGAVGYLAYDVVRFFERLPEGGRDDLGFPDSFFLVPDALVVFDNVKHTLQVVACARIAPRGDPDAAYDEAVRLVEETVGKLRSPLPPRRPPAGARTATTETWSNFERPAFVAAVERAKEYVRAGDIIQVVPSQRFTTRLDVETLDLYRSLRTLNPSPYMFYLSTPAGDLIGSSPEVLLRVEGRRLTTRPIAGTRPRGASEVEDRLLEKELLADPKELAEHVMLVDLSRNDVGRVARIGSVRVTEFETVERYSHVMHIVSNVEGTLKSGLDAFDALRACFPAGTLTGASKVRAMEIIAELEPTRRGPYGGAVGYVSWSGDLDMCITIRTMMARGGLVHVQAGAGIVADSDPEREYEETVNKARALMRAIEMARTGWPNE